MAFTSCALHDKSSLGAPEPLRAAAVPIIALKLGCLLYIKPVRALGRRASIRTPSLKSGSARTRRRSRTRVSWLSDSPTFWSSSFPCLLPLSSGQVISPRSHCLQALADCPLSATFISFRSRRVLTPHVCLNAPNRIHAVSVAILSLFA